MQITRDPKMTKSIGTAKDPGNHHSEDLMEKDIIADHKRHDINQDVEKDNARWDAATSEGFLSRARTRKARARDILRTITGDAAMVTTARCMRPSLPRVHRKELDTIMTAPLALFLLQILTETTTRRKRNPRPEEHIN